MRISDWSSDVCSSDLLGPEDFKQRVLARLGMDLPMLTRMPCVCKHGSIDTEGFHLTAQCPVGNQRFRTHDAIAVTWVAMLRQVGCVGDRKSTRLNSSH